MAQNITVKLVGKEYNFTAQTSEMEQYLRCAADDVNARFDNYTQKYPDKSYDDKLALTALGIGTHMLQFKRKLGTLNQELEELKALTDDYLSAIEE